MPGCPVHIINRLPCNLNPIVKEATVQFGHQDSNGNITEVEQPPKSFPNLPCNETFVIDTAKEKPNVGAVSVICLVNIAGRDRLYINRVNTPLPGQPLHGVDAVISFDFEFEFNRGDTDVESRCGVHDALVGS